MTCMTMVKKSINILVFVASFALSFIDLSAQDKPTFSYTPSAEEIAVNRSELHYAGLGAFIVNIDELFHEDLDLDFVPLSAELFYEYSMLVLPPDENYNISVNIGPQIIFPTVVGLRLPVGADFRLGCLAQRDTKSGARGFLIGAGYEPIALIRNYTSGSSFVRAGIGIENISIIYQYNIEHRFLQHNVYAGIKIDW